MRALLPQPTAVQWRDEGYTLTPATTLGPAAADAAPAAALVWRLLSRTTGLPLAPGAEPDVVVQLAADLPEEGYRLDVGPGGVRITAGGPRGALWAAQTLLQLGPADIYAAPRGHAVPLEGATISDSPRFARRGAMLDSARHFVPLADVLDFVDWLARHKLNVFHWHLTDDQGWRVALDKYPRLATHASWRARTTNRAGGDDHTPHGGYYTLAQIKLVADYARDLGIETVPELDFPGHATAALHAYPEFATDPTAVTEVAHYPQIFPNVLNFSPAALDFVHDAWQAVIDATGAKYVHIGGDEVPTTHWEASPEVRQRAAAWGVRDVRQLQRWFTEHLRDWLRERGVTPIGWDEIIDDGPVPGMVCQAWRGAEAGMRAAQHGMDVIMSPLSHTYLDFYQSPLRSEPYAQGVVLPIEEVYAFDPTAGLDAAAAARVLGTQFQLWAEFQPSYRKQQYQAWPRGCALAEVAWSAPEGRSWQAFAPRLEAHLTRLDAAGINYRPLHGPHPWQEGGTGWFQRPAAD